MFKSLADSNTWMTNEEQETKENTTPADPSDSIDCDLEEEYDIPKNRESLNNLVKNLSFIVSKLKEQIQKLDEKEHNRSDVPSKEEIDAVENRASTKLE